MPVRRWWLQGSCTIVLIGALALLSATSSPVDAALESTGPHAPLMTYESEVATQPHAAKNSTSTNNWSGYVLTGGAGAFTQISGRWQVPKVAPTTGSTYSDAWIGVDGFPAANKNLIQIGTEQDWVNGAARYYAWDEILPITQVKLFAVRPGDTIVADITDASGSWILSIEDVTTNTFPNPPIPAQSYYGPQISAEWIVEAPTVNGKGSALAHYGKVTFESVVNFGTPHLTAADRVTMIQNGRTVSVPSNPSSPGDAFTVAYGSKRPAPPSF